LRRTRIPGRNQNDVTLNRNCPVLKCCEGREFLEGIKTSAYRICKITSFSVAKDENSWKESKLLITSSSFTPWNSCEGREFLEGIKTRSPVSYSMSSKLVAKDENSWKESKQHSPWSCLPLPI